MVQVNEEEDNAEKRQADSFISYISEVQELNITVKEALKIRELLLSSLKNLSLPQAQLLVQWNEQCGVIEAECEDVSMQGLPITFPAKYSIKTMQNYLQLKQIEINELVSALKQLFELVEIINLKKNKIIQRTIEKQPIPDEKIENIEVEKEKDINEVLSREIILWLDNNKKDFINKTDVYASVDSCKNYIKTRFNVSEEKFKKIWDNVVSEWVCQNQN